jgi:hypothetical protein
VEELRHRLLQREYPHIWVDDLYDKVRCDGRVVSLEIMVSYGGVREWAEERFYSGADVGGDRAVVQGVYAEAEEARGETSEDLYF